MKPQTPISHNMALFTELEALCADGPVAIRRGRMFGCPAIHVGRRMALCVYEDGIGMRVPEAVAVEAKAVGRAEAFTPYGKAPMREWIMVDAPEDLGAFRDLFDAALRFAGENNAGA